MKLAGITRVRNEEHIIKDTLDHISDYCNHGIFVYDDGSTDSTASISRSHRAVVNVISRPHARDFLLSEGVHREQVRLAAQEAGATHLLYFDADERFEFDPAMLEKYDALVMRLFDFYITPEDKEKSYKERKWMGPEYRDICMAWKAFPDIAFYPGCNRIPNVPHNYKAVHHGYVKHYGKAISVENFEAKCRHYMRSGNPFYVNRWKKRVGKAVHTLSDFGRPLIQWHEKEEKGLLLTE